MVESDGSQTDATRRLNVKKQTLDDAYAAPANFLEIDVVNPMTTITAGKKRYTDYEVRMRVSLVNTVHVNNSYHSLYFSILIMSFNLFSIKWFLC